MRVPLDGEFCEYHVNFPNLGVAAALYHVTCQEAGTCVTVEGLVDSAYPRPHPPLPQIHNVELMCRRCAERVPIPLAITQQSAIKHMVIRVTSNPEIGRRRVSC